MSIGKIRTLLYAAARILGDINAVRRGPRAIERRIENRILGKIFGRFFR